ncbi:MAG: hypothetical protein ACP5T0_04040 [Verrucomicrobiia bacterium]
MINSKFKNLPVIFALKQEAKYFNPPPGIQLFYCGMGNKNAEKFINELLKNSRPSILFTCGLAGALNPGIKLNSIVFSASEELALLFNQLDAIEGRFYCSNRVICSSKEKLALYRETGADAVEMESGIIKEICKRHNIPAVTVRVISDIAQEDLPLDFNDYIDENGDIKISKILMKIATNPQLAARLINFQKQTDNAARALGEFLNKFFKEATQFGK